MLEHYNVAVLPARPRKPKDKAKAEVGVQVVERWIMARIRHEIFHALHRLISAFGVAGRLNNKIMQKLGYSRAELFIQLDKPALKPLPEASYSYTLVKKVRVHADYHVEIDKHYYSVPCSLLGQQLEAWISGELVRLFNQGRRLLCTRASVLMATVPATSTCLKLIDSMPPGRQSVFWNGRGT